MGETKRQREARHKAILELLNAPDGRERSDADIARQIGCSPRSVAYVRQQNPTPEELDRTMQALDSIFPGIHQWHREAQARKAALAQQKEASNDGLGVNSPHFGRTLDSFPVEEAPDGKE